MYYSFGVPFDQKKTGVSAEDGPQAIRDALNNLYAFSLGTGTDISNNYFSLGDIAARTPDDAEKNIEEKLADVMRDGTPVVFGGEHTITYFVLKSLKKIHERIAVVQFDAHLDMAESGKLSHDSFMRNALDDKLAARLIHVGLRDCDAGELSFAKMNNDTVTIIKADDVALDMDRAKKILGEIEDPVYVTIDIDVLDPSIAPAVYAPAPGGLDARTVVELLGSLRNVIGMDIVEVCSVPKPNDITAIHAAFILREFLCGLQTRGTDGREGK